MLIAQAESTLGMLNLIVQGGSFALLAFLIVYGLPRMYHKISTDQARERTDFVLALAQERKEAVEALSEKRREFLDAQCQQRDDFVALARDLSKTFRDEALAERVACERHFETLAGAMAKGNEAVMAAVRTMAEQIQSHAARNLQWNEMLKRREDELTREKAGREKAEEGKG